MGWRDAARLGGEEAECGGPHTHTEGKLKAGAAPHTQTKQGRFRLPVQSLHLRRLRHLLRVRRLCELQFPVVPSRRARALAVARASS